MRREGEEGPVHPGLLRRIFELVGGQLLEEIGVL